MCDHGPNSTDGVYATPSNNPSNVSNYYPTHQHTKSTIPNTRPGRIFLRKTSDQSPEESYGDTIHTKCHRHIRCFHQNTKGLTTRLDGADYEYYFRSLQDIKVDIASLVETNTPWQHYHLRNGLTKMARRICGNSSNIVFGSPSFEIDPTDKQDVFQAGGTVTALFDVCSTMIHGKSIDDQSGLGRWSGCTLRGKNDQKLTVFTVYRSCATSISSAPLGSTFAREYEYFRQLGHKNPNPRRQLLQDLKQAIETQRQQEHGILITIDANSTISEDRQLQEFLFESGLIDLHTANPAPSTYIGSASRRIDYMFGCPRVKQATTRAGTLSYLQGPQADHRGLFIDLDPQVLFDTPKLTLPPITPYATRMIKSTHPDHVEKFNATMVKYYQDHNMIDRIVRLQRVYKFLPNQEVQRRLEKWDRDQGRAIQHAENILKKPQPQYPWSPKLRNAGVIKHYWRLRFREAKHGENHTISIDRLEAKIQRIDKSFHLPDKTRSHDLFEILKKLKIASADLRAIQKRATQLRYQSYYDLLAKYKSDTDPATNYDSQRKAKIVQNTIKAEKCRAMFANLRFFMKPHAAKSKGITNLIIPTSTPSAANEFTSTSNTYDVIHHSDNNEINWTTISEKETIEDHLLQYNRQAFRAASASPCGQGRIFDELSFTGNTQPAADLLETGTIPDNWKVNDKPYLHEFLKAFQKPTATNIAKAASQEIKSEITEEELSQGFKTWKEKTSTSPSGRHLGIYKTMIQEPILLQCLASFMNIAINSGVTIQRWCQATNVMIEKDPGHPKINRLRIIHLFEADYNLYLKLQWGHRLIRAANDRKLIHPGQHGSVPGRNATDPVMLNQLTTDLIRIKKVHYAHFDNDASACYDRILVPIAMLAARRWGMPQNAVELHAKTLEAMHYTVKTTYGISEKHYTGSKDEPLFGTGQGSGASPAAWLSIAVVLMQTLEAISSERVVFSSPGESNYVHTRLIDAFVDDTSLSFTEDDITQTFDNILARLQDVAQKWERVLFYSGGALNLKKCSWQILHWTWPKGVPTLGSQSPTGSTINLETQNTRTKIPIRQTLPNEANRMLGVYLSPSGDTTTQLRVLTQKADILAQHLLSPYLSPQDARTIYRTMYLPALMFPMPAIAANEEQFERVQSKWISALLRKLGASRKTPTAVRHGPLELGGMNLADLRTETGIARIKYMFNAIYRRSAAGRLIIVALKTQQIESGIDNLLLEHPKINIPYLTPTWLTSLRRFMANHNLSITVTDIFTAARQGKNDDPIMNLSTLTRYTISQQHAINRVRIHLQVFRLSDLCNKSDPTSICSYQLHGKRPPTFTNNNAWPRQPIVTAHQARLWRKYIASTWLRYGTKWRHRPVDNNPASPNSNTGHTSTPTKYNSLQEYLCSLGKWYQRLLSEYHQEATDNQVWSAFRSKRWIDVASDGGLNDTTGTFGWKIYDTKRELVLFRGSGPVDGPPEVNSSTRSELGGYAAPLFLITIISRFWGLRHRCKFYWVVDSKSAIVKVKLYSGKEDNHPYPDNSDYISLIRELQRELRRPIKSIWVKGHQDDSQDYTALSPRAQLNVDADLLATQYYSKGKNRPIHSIPHLPNQLISLTINGTRFPGHLENNLRWHINGSYMRKYLQKRRGWSDTTWNTIDFESFGGHFKSLNPTQQVSQTKFIHDLHMTGVRKGKIVTKAVGMTGAQLLQCPCCISAPESQYHLLHCSKNPARTQAILSFSSMTVQKADVCWGITVLRDAIEQWMMDPTQNPALHNWCSPKLHQLQLPTENIPEIQRAFQEQHAIGWHNAMRGYLAKSWAHLAAIHRYDPSKKNTRDGQGRIRNTIRDIYDMTTEIWKGRNSILHDNANKAQFHQQHMESQEIIYLHGNSQLLPPGDRYLCRQDINALLNGRPSSRRRWLNRARRARARNLTDGHHQTEITDFFLPQDGTEHSLHQRLPSTARPEKLNSTPPDTSQTITRWRHHDRPPDTVSIKRQTNPTSYRTTSTRL
jgi:hypothetical protein